MRPTRILTVLMIFGLAAIPGLGTTHPAGPAVCTGVAPAEKSCSTGSDHFINVHEASTVLFIYPEFGSFRGRLRGVLTGIGNNKSVIFHCDYVGDAATDVVGDLTTACQTSASNYPDVGDQFKYECFASALGSNTGNASGRFFCGVNHT